MAASPFEPADGVAGRLWPEERGGEQPLHLADGKRDQAGVARWRLVWPGGRRRLGAVRFLSWAAVTAQIARAAMTSTMWRSIAV